PITRRSTKFAAVARTATRTSLSFGTGFGRSPRAAALIGPNSRTTTARMAIPHQSSVTMSSRRLLSRLPPHRHRRRLAALDLLDEIALARLAAGRRWHAVELQDIFRHIVFGETGGIEVGEKLARREPAAGAIDHRETHLLAQAGIAHRDRRRVLDRRMLHGERLDARRLDVVATANDDVLLA